MHVLAFAMTSEDDLNQPPDELFDVLTSEGVPTGRTKARARIHRDGDWHRAVHVWVYGVRDAGAFLLFQRRGMGKDTWPGKLDATVGGHFAAGEKVPDVLREVKEEIGVSVCEQDLRFAGVRVRSSELEPGIIDRELQDIYLWQRNAALPTYVPNFPELEAIVAVDLDPFLSFSAGEAEQVGGIELSARTREVAEVILTEQDFLPGIDRYYFRVGLAVRSVLRGDQHVSV